MALGGIRVSRLGMIKMQGIHPRFNQVTSSMPARHASSQAMSLAIAVRALACYSGCMLGCIPACLGSRPRPPRRFLRPGIWAQLTAHATYGDNNSSIPYSVTRAKYYYLILPRHTDAQAAMHSPLSAGDADGPGKGCEGPTIISRRRNMHGAAGLVLGDKGLLSLSRAPRSMIRCLRRDIETAKLSLVPTDENASCTVCPASPMRASC
jgi:hypothetical protein